MLKPPPSISFLKTWISIHLSFNSKNWLVSMEFPGLGWFHDPYWKSLLDSIVPHKLLYSLGQMNPFFLKAVPGTHWPISVSRRHHVSLGPILLPTKNNHQLFQPQIDWWNIYLYIYIYIFIYIHIFPQIALAIGVLTSSWRWGFADFVDSLRGGGLSHRESFEVSSGVCVGVTVRLSHRVSLEVSSGVCRGQGSQIQDRAVVTGCCWRCNLLMCVGVRGLQI